MIRDNRYVLKKRGQENLARILLFRLKDEDWDLFLQGKLTVFLFILPRDYSYYNNNFLNIVAKQAFGEDYSFPGVIMVNFLNISSIVTNREENFLFCSFRSYHHTFREIVSYGK